MEKQVTIRWGKTVNFIHQFSPSRLTSRNVTHCKQAHACVSINGPFLSLTVGLAAVVHKARVVPFGSRIYNPILFTHTNICIIEVHCVNFK